jgi:dTDP-4-amino-4,6-dideoxygalactose transaminase
MFDRFTSKVPSCIREVAPPASAQPTDTRRWGCAALRLAAFQHREACSGLRRAFADLPLVLPPRPAPGDRHAWHLYVIRLADGAPLARDRFIERMFEAGIGCSVHYIPLHLHPYWRDRYGLRAEQFPHSQHAYERMVSLPMYSRMTEADVHRVAAAAREALVG